MDCVQFLVKNGQVLDGCPVSVKKWTGIIVLIKI